MIEFRPTLIQLDVLSLLYGPGTGGNIVVRLTERDISEFLLEVRNVLVWDHELVEQLDELESVGLLRAHRDFNLDGIRTTLWALQPLARDFVRAMADQEEDDDSDS